MFSKPGGLGLSINTTAANASPAQTAQGGGLFGSSTQPAQQQQQQQPGGGLFGSQTTQNTQQTGGGLFGAKPAQTTQQQGGGLFGAKPEQSTQQASGGLFGNVAKPATGGGLFGQSTATQQQQQQPQQQNTGGLFGSVNAQQQPQQQTTGGLFGSSTAQQQPQQQQQTGGLLGGFGQQKPTGGLFGSSTAQPQQQQQQQQQTGGGLFGSQPAAVSTGNVFGQTQPKPGNVFASLGQQPQQQQQPSNAGLTMGQKLNQQTVPGVRIDLSNIKGTTKFNDLVPELQKDIQTCDEIIQKFMGQADQIKSFMDGHQGDIQRLTQDVDWLVRKFDGVKTTLEDDVKVVAQLKEMVKSDADIAKAAFSGAEQLKLPAHYHTTWLTASKPAPKSKDNEEPDLEDCITLFGKEADRLNQLHLFQVQKIKEMEHHMPGVENGLYERMRALRDGAPQFPAFSYAVELLDTVKALGDEIIRAAGVIVETREQLTQLQLRPLPSRK